MYYHTALLFDYTRFSQVARPLAEFVETGNFEPVIKHAEKIIARSSENKFILKKFGFGENITELNPMLEYATGNSRFQNSMIGKFFLIAMSEYLKPCPISIGSDWRNLNTLLQSIGFSSADIDILLYGQPIGTLVSESAKGCSQVLGVKHSDPYWRWIRPLYIYGQGGWINLDEIHRLRNMLITAEKKCSNILENAPWRQSGLKGLKKSIKMLTSAVNSQMGLYVFVLWDTR